MKTFTRIEPTTIYTVGDRFKRDVVVKRFRTEDGLEHEFTTFYPEHQQGAAVIGLTSDCQVVVVRQFRPGRASYCYEIPGGGLEDEDNGSIEAAARREFFEETGYRPGGWNIWEFTHGMRTQINQVTISWRRTVILLGSRHVIRRKLTKELRRC